MRHPSIRELLAAACAIAMSSVAIAQAPLPLTKSEFEALAQSPAVNTAVVACDGDRWRLCPTVFPGGGRIVRCLAAHAESLSPQCRSAMLQARDTIFAARGGPPPWPAK
jgi:hypothetical protein